MVNRTNHKSGAGMKQASIAARAENCERILAVLARGPMISADISKAVGLPTSAGYSCLSYMRDRLDQIHMMEQRDNQGRNYWALGQANAQLEKVAKPPKKTALFIPPDHRRIIVPARQVGMVRDALLAAFFGPAGEQRP